VVTTATEEHLARLHLPPCRWAFPPPAHADPSGLVVVGGDLAPETLVTAYTSGLFPMPVGRRRRIGWWSPEPRGILPVDALRVSRSLRRSTRRYEVRVDTEFTQTMTRCGDPRRPHGWITPDFIAAYSRLHDLGVAHSIECWSPDGELVGGLYGISLGGLFAGESMFHAAPDASKVALVALVELLGTEATTLLDIQWLTPHLASLGAIEVGRDSYLAALAVALRQPTPTFTPGRWSAARGS
jgi:leucyl/phenylalanyl-tRNA--protein transferase